MPQFHSELSPDGGVSGERAPLSSLLGDEPAKPAVALRMFQRVVSSLAAIHAAGLSHLPLSPETVLVGESGEAFVQSQNRPPESSDTVAFRNTKYSAPETFVGGGSISCEAADCYVLGFMFYEILAGKRAFLAQFAGVESGHFSWLKWHADKGSQARPLTEVCPSIGRFAGVIDGMMLKDPEKRVKSLAYVAGLFSDVDDQTTRTTKPAARQTAPAADDEATVSPRTQPPVVPAPIASTPRRSIANLSPWIAGLGVALVAASLGLIALYMRRARPQPPPPAAAGPRKPVTPAPAPKIELTPPPVSAPLPVAPPLSPPIGQSDLHFESRLNSGAVLILDDMKPLDLAEGVGFEGRVGQGVHKFRVVAGSKSSLFLQFEVQPDGTVSFTPPQERSSLPCVVVVSSEKSATVYGLPASRFSESGTSLPEEGKTLAIDRVVDVAFGTGPGERIRFMPGGSKGIRIVVVPEIRNRRIPVEISANVPYATIEINGEKLKRTLEKGSGIVRLLPGSYSVKLSRTDYQDSAAQNLSVSEGDEGRKLQFLLAPILHYSALVVTAAPEGVEIEVDSAAIGLTDAGGLFKTKVNPGKHTVTFRKAGYEDLAAVRDFPAGGSVELTAQGMKPLGKIVFRVVPAGARIVCRRETDSRSEDCVNNQPCFLRAGAYEVTAEAPGFKTDVNHIRIGAGEVSYDWKLERAVLKPGDFFENGDRWTVERDGAWSFQQPGYSFTRNNLGTFVFDIAKPAGAFLGKKLSLLVNYRSEENRVLYTLDDHSLRRNVRAPGVQMSDYTVAHEMPGKGNYQLRIDVSPGRVIVRNAAGKVLDDFPLVNAAAGKLGFLGKVTLRVVQP